MVKKIITVLSILVTLTLFGSRSFAADPPLRPDTFTAEYPVYDSVQKENRIMLNWSASAGADFYILEMSTDSNWAGQTISEVKSGITTLSYEDKRSNMPTNPTSGTVFRYKLYAAAYVRDENGNPILTQVVKSTSYASVTALTDPSVSTQALSTSEIKLVWDDIKYNGSSISYDIIKYKKDINVGTEQIRADQIGTSAKRVNGKLEYSIKNLDKSTEYTFKLAPVLDATAVKFNSQVSITGATNISAILQRYNESILKFMWDEYQGSVPSTELYYKVIEITIENNQKSYRVISTPEVPYYFIQINPSINPSYLVEVRRKDNDIKVAESSEISLMDITIPTPPASPNVVLGVSSTSANLIWDIPTNINNSRDASVKYDVWMFTDPQYLDNIRTFYNVDSTGVTDNRVATELQIIGTTSSNPNFSISKVSGKDKYKYVLNGLIPNSIYYVGVVAKKTFLMQDSQNQQVILNITYTSEPFVGTIKTLSGNLEQPVAIVAPMGVNIKVDSNGRAMVEKDKITIEWPLGQDVNGSFNYFYQNDVYFKVGFEEYTDSFDKSKINDPNNTEYGIQDKSFTVYRQSQKAYAVITGLDSNTPYVFWVKAYRDVVTSDVVTKVSEASDPIIAVTLPDYTVPDIKPPVPSLTVIDNQYKDKVTVQFNSLQGMKYTIAWGLEDNVAKKSGQKEYTPGSSMTPDSVVVDGLEPETLYYFWIMATNESINSEWSDSVIGRTVPIPPPDAPMGFGVKKILKDGELVPDIGEHNITVQWDALNGMSYILEISRQSDFSNSQKTDITSGSEYKITTFNNLPLTANTRYWIRIFAKDESTEKISQSSIYLTVKTVANYDEYDSSSDKDMPLDGKITSEEINGNTGIWSLNITTENGERLIEKIRSQVYPDYKFDLSETSVEGITRRELTLPYKVFETMSSLNQNIVVKTDKVEAVLLPNFIHRDVITSLTKGIPEDVNVKISFYSYTPSTIDVGQNNIALSDINKIETSIYDSSFEKQFNAFDDPIKIKMNYTDNSANGIVKMFYRQLNSDVWQELHSEKNTSDKNYLVVFNKGTGYYLVKKQLPDNRQLGNNSNKYEIDALLSSGILKSVDKEKIRAKDNLILGDAVKMVLDMAGSSYEEEYMAIAEKAGILDNISNIGENAMLSKQDSISILMRLYEIKTGNSLQDIDNLRIYKDKDSISPKNIINIENALNMRLVEANMPYLKPLDKINRGDFLTMLSRMNAILENR